MTNIRFPAYRFRQTYVLNSNSYKETLCDRSNTHKNIRHERWSGVNTHVPANQRKHSKVQQFMDDFQQKKKTVAKLQFEIKSRNSSLFFKHIKIN